MDFYNLKRHKVSCTTVVAESIQKLVLNKVFLWNYLLHCLLLQALNYIESVKAFWEKNY